MRYIWAPEHGRFQRRVMHIARFDAAGRMLSEPLCHVRLPFTRSINAPFALGQKVCRLCTARLP